MNLRQDPNKRKPTVKELNLRYGDNNWLMRDGIIEWICEHGVGHTVWSPHDYNVHGCDGCCRKLLRDKNGRSKISST